MEIGAVFSGNALARVRAGGAVRLPAFVRETLARRAEGRRLVFAAHETMPCLSAYEPAYRAVFADRNGSRRLFGFAEQAEYDRAGRIVLPAMMRWKGRIEGLALFVGTGGAFEIWNPAVALETSDPDLREMADYHLHLQQDERELVP